MNKYKTRPFQIEAVRFTGDNASEIVAFTNDRFRQGEWIPGERGLEWEVFDYLHATWVRVGVGDYIIRGSKGEYYPCEESVFEAKYEPV